MKKEYDFSKGKRGAVLASEGKTRITILRNSRYTIKLCWLRP